MNSRSIKKLVILFCVAYLPVQAMAWGMLGHRIVGQIAESYLTPKAKAEIKKLLGNETIAMASNWADFIKSDTTKKHLDPWHYINAPKNLSFVEYRDFINRDTTINAYNRVNFMIAELKKKNLPKEQKVFYLKMLIHIIEDLSQPLHVSPDGTRGGNEVKVQWFSTPTNLHQMWDFQLIEHQQLSYTEYANAINFITPAQRHAWTKGGMVDWLYDSYTMAAVLHNDITMPNQRLGYEYNYKYLHTLNQQLLKGGVRLAAVLNSIFK